MEITTRTSEAAALQTASFCGLAHTYPEKSTLNQLLDIQSGITPAPNQWPQMKYMVIGNGGNRTTTDTDGLELRTPIQHRITDLGMFRPMPLILRDINNDLSAIERARYGLRRIELHNSVPKIAYYAKRLDYTGVTVQRQIITKVDGQTPVVSQMVYSDANLSPQPTQLQPGQANSTSGQFFSPICKVWVGIESEWEADELINVSRIKFGHDYGAMITEMGMVMGVDKQVSVDSGVGNSILFNEVIGAQVAAHIACDYNIAFGTNSRAGTYINVGIAEPMFIIG